MATRKIHPSIGEFYHVYNRGVDKRSVFENVSDYQRFIELLYLCNSTKPVNVRDVRKTFDSVFEFDRKETLVSIGAYCLMPNHFHILVTPNEDNSLSTFMNKLSTSYTMYFNKKYERSGSLFQGNYKAKHADTDEYLKYLFSYIHLNPEKLFMSDSINREQSHKAEVLNPVLSYGYSSLSDYLKVDRVENKILEMAKFPEYFTDSDDLKKDLSDWSKLTLD